MIACEADLQGLYGSSCNTIDYSFRSTALHHTSPAAKKSSEQHIHIYTIDVREQMKTDYQVMRVASTSPTHEGHEISNFEHVEQRKSGDNQETTLSAESQETKFGKDTIHLFC